MPLFQRSALAAAVACAALSANTSAIADTSPLQLAAVDYRPALEVMVVTATRTDLDLYRALAPTDVIDRDRIERLQPVTFVETVQQSPGVDFATAGGPGSASSLYLRGTNTSHTLFLLDGQRIGSATLGSTSIEQLMPEMIERVEIVRGPRSSLYGSDAIGGVVQLLTRRAGDKPSAYVKAGYGDHGTKVLAAGGDARIGALRGGLYLSRYDTDGIDNVVDDTPPNQDDDAYRNNSGLLKLGYDLANGGSIDVGRFESHSRGDTDDVYAGGFSEPYNRHRLENTWLQLDTPVVGIWQTKASIARTVDDDDQFDKLSSFSRSDFRTTRDSASWQNDLVFDERHTATLGVDYYEEKIDSSSLYTKPDGTPVDERDNTGWFAQYLYSGSPVDLQLGLRVDDSSAYGDETTGNIAIGFHLDARHRLIVSYGEAFKAPTFNDLYWPVDPWSQGNPNLKSESSENYEIELRGDYSKLRWSVAVYRNEVDNLIEWAALDPNDPWGVWVPSNVANAEIEGVDASIATELAGWLIGASYSYVDAVDADNDRRLVNRAQQLFNIEADRSFGRWEVGASWRVRDERYGDIANTQRLGGFGLLDLRVAFNPSDNWQLQLKLDNVFDKDYQLNSAYNQKGAGWLATATWRL